MACLLRQLGDKYALRSSVTFAEWMNTVKLIISARKGESLEEEAYEKQIG
jgi:hypothetical protein